MKRIFIELEYEGDLSDLSACHEFEKILENSDFELRRFNNVDYENLFNVIIRNG